MCVRVKPLVEDGVGPFDEDDIAAVLAVDHLQEEDIVLHQQDDAVVADAVEGVLQILVFAVKNLQQFGDRESGEHLLAFPEPELCDVLLQPATVDERRDLLAAGLAR
jgi:hypothetical protein